jgi:hypothetical protein
MSGSAFFAREDAESSDAAGGYSHLSFANQNSPQPVFPTPDAGQKKF